MVAVKLNFDLLFELIDHLVAAGRCLANLFYGKDRVG